MIPADPVTPGFLAPFWIALAVIAALVLIAGWMRR